MDTEFLIKLSACKPAIQWTEKQASKEEAWKACDNGAWMLWFLGKNKCDKNKIVKICCRVSSMALTLVPKEYNSARKVVSLAENWVSGDSTFSLEKLKEEVKKADLECWKAPYSVFTAWCSVNPFVSLLESDVEKKFAAIGKSASEIVEETAYAHSSDLAISSKNEKAAKELNKFVLAHAADVVREFFPEYPIKEEDTRPFLGII